ncbi:MAG: hypothetical protein R3236_10790, partial [Phycisphaeraceae bacterium]|nr:hypothetical protein [Phycisphaeraceae bacterium]
MVRWIGLGIFLTAAVPAAPAQQPTPGRVPASVARADTSAGPTDTGDPQHNPAALRDAAIKMLLKAAVGPDAALRANALEGLKDHLSLSQPMCRRALGDPQPVVRFAAVVISGTHAPKHPEFKKLTERIYPLLKDPNLSVRAAALYALHRMGEP